MVMISREGYRSILAYLTLTALIFGFSLPVRANDKAGKPTKKSSEVSVINADTSIIPAPIADLLGKSVPAAPTFVPQGVDIGEESEPNNTAATADVLSGPQVKITGNIYPSADVDFYSFSAVAGDKVATGVMTSWSTTSVDSVLELYATDGTTILETDLDDGSFGPTSSTISGFVIPASGTYYIRVRGGAATTQVRPYELYFTLRSGSPTPETEPNNSVATATPLAPSGFMIGAVTPAADTDYYSVTLNAGDTVFLSLNTDPERDNIQWNGRLGFGLFGNTPANQILVGNDSSAGSASNPLSEAFYFTVRDSGTYFVYADENAAGPGAGTNTYELSVSVFAQAASVNCTLYNSADTPIVIPTGPGAISSTITVPASTERIVSTRVRLDVTHAFMQDLDTHLVSPAGNNNGLFTDVGAATAGGSQTSMNWWVDDRAALPPAFAVSAGFHIKPELAYRLGWFRGENPSGNWQLDIRDDATGDGGTLNNWTLELCTEAISGGAIVYSEDFEPLPIGEGSLVPESGDGGYTHSGTLDEWEYGVPNTVGTTTSNPVAPFIGCDGGSLGCWKTDLDNTYDLSSTMDLLSPIIDLTAQTGNLRLEWAMRYQIESASFDHGFVEVQDVANPANNVIVWQHLDATMTNSVGNPTVNIPASAGWGVYKADISAFAGKNVRIRFHVDGDNTISLGGMAIDNVLIRNVAPVAANTSVSGRVIDASGNAIARAEVTMTASNGEQFVVRTNPFGFFRFESMEVGENYILDARAKGHTFAPQVIAVNDEVIGLEIVALD